MSYQKSDGTYVHTEGLGAAVVASASRNSSSNGTAIETGGRVIVRDLVLNITAYTGTSIAVRVETSPDGTNWGTAGAFPTHTTGATATYYLSCAVGRYMRIAWTVSSSTTTFSVGVLGGELV